MKKTVALGTLIALLSGGNAQAANMAVITSPPTILNIMILLVAGACLTVCLQVVSLVKGGLFGKIWQLFMLGFALLGVSQVGMLLNTLEIVSLPGYIVPALMVLMAATFCYGLFEAKRVLS